MDIVCTKCGSEKVFIVQPDTSEKTIVKKTMDDLQRESTQGVPLVYHLTTYKCAECGYSVSF